MADPRDISVNKALTILKKASALPSVNVVSDDYKLHCIDELRKIYLDHPNPAMGSLDNLFKVIDQAYKVQDLEVLLVLRIGVAETVKKAGAIYKSSRGRNLKAMGRSFQLLTWWCQVHLDVESLCAGAGYKDAA